MTIVDIWLNCILRYEAVIMIMISFSYFWWIKDFIFIFQLSLCRCISWGFALRLLVVVWAFVLKPDWTIVSRMRGESPSLQTVPFICGTGGLKCTDVNPECPVSPTQLWHSRTRRTTAKQSTTPVSEVEPLYRRCYGYVMNGIFAPWQEAWISVC